MTRNHYLHSNHNMAAYPHANPYQRCDEDGPSPSSRPRYESRQAPVSVRLARDGSDDGGHRAARRRRSSASQQQPGELMRTLRASAEAAPTSSPPFSRHASNLSAPITAPTAPVSLPIAVTCHARTRVPTPHGNVFIHLYRNTHDAKEHLAFVIDKAQLASVADAPNTDGWIRSRSLDAVWREGETEQERIVRGAYVGRLLPDRAVASTPETSASGGRSSLPDPLVRIHSECFTGETIGSQRCDCGEQLDEAFRLAANCPSGRGVIVYLRQEGRGIGLLEKLRAYNLQDLGHDTVTANLLLGHGADTRTYDVAGAILRDLGVDSCRLMTNNPDKIKQIEHEGVRVVERVAMVPRSWRTTVAPVSPRSRRRAAQASERRSPTTEDDEDDQSDEERAALLRRSGVGMIGAGDTQSPELERYLRTKVARMGHILDLPSSEASSASDLRHDAIMRSAARPQRPKLTMADSVASLAETDPEGVDCGCAGSDCEGMASLSSDEGGH